MFVWFPIAKVRDDEYLPAAFPIHRMASEGRAIVLIFDPATGWTGAYGLKPDPNGGQDEYGCILGKIGDARILCEYVDPPGFSQMPKGTVCES